MPFPDSMEGSEMRNRMRIVRDTLIVLGIQIVFRFTLLLRRWNY
jgi:hypothetical protein